MSLKKYRIQDFYIRWKVLVSVESKSDMNKFYQGLVDIRIFKTSRDAHKFCEKMKSLGYYCDAYGDMQHTKDIMEYEQKVL